MDCDYPAKEFISRWTNKPDQCEGVDYLNVPGSFSGVLDHHRQPDGSINATYGSGDGIHLNDAGHQLLYNRVVASRLYELISAPRTLTLQPVSNLVNAVQIEFDTLPGINYVLESSLDFVGWQTETNTAGSGVPTSLNVPATNASSLFRLRLEAVP